MSLDVWKFVLNITKLRRRTAIIRCSSGQPADLASPMSPSTPAAGPEVADTLSVTQTYLCKGGVTTPRLLQLTRRLLFEDAKAYGANTLVNESWTCDIFRRKGDLYEAKVVYQAGIAKTSKESSGLPVAIDQARGIPGMMTILSATD